MSDSLFTATPDLSSDPRTKRERLEDFGRAMDAISRETKADMGPEDLRYIRRIDAVSHSAGVLGRVLIAVSPGPVSFSLGVLSLWLHKQLQATEVGHGALHGAYNRMEGAERYHSQTYRWNTPIDEESWRHGHNGKHHGLTNVAGSDPDTHFGPIRLTPETPHRAIHYIQLPFTLCVLLPNFLAGMNLHFTGLSDVWSTHEDDKLDFIEDRSPESVRGAYRKALRKFVPYYAREYLLWPAVAAVALGLSPVVFFKSMFGTFLAEKLRNIYTGLTIICGHVGEETASYEEGTRPRSKGERYAMQVEATNNFHVPWFVSVLCGGLDKQIEHHLFPTLPPNRLREIAPRVEAACAAHGVKYRQQGWGKAIVDAFSQITRLSRPTRSRAPAPTSFSPSPASPSPASPALG